MGTVHGHSLNTLFLYRTVNHYFSSKSYPFMLHKVQLFYHAVEIRTKLYRQALQISNICFSEELLTITRAILLVWLLFTHVFKTAF